MRQNPRKTKIVCTIGPATQSAEKVRALIAAGMNVARLNFSHGNHASHGKMIRTLREISRDMGMEVGILQDLGGPKIRLGKLSTPERHLQAGERVALRPMATKDPSHIPVSYPYLLEDLTVGDHILLADGLVLLKAESKTTDAIICEVLVGGIIHSYKGANLPFITLRIPSFTEKDRKDLAFGLQEGVDFVALTLSWGVETGLVTPFTDTEEIFDLAARWSLEHEIVESGSRVVVTAGTPVGTSGTTNLIKVIEIEKT